MFATVCTIRRVRRVKQFWNFLLFAEHSEQQTVSHCQFGIRWTLNFMPFKDVFRVGTVALA